MQRELQIVECSLGEIEWTPKPDIGGLPLGANQGAGSPGGAEAARTFVPTAGVEIRFIPIIRRFFCGESPGDWLQASIRYHLFDLGWSWQRRPRADRVLVTARPLLPHLAVGQHFHEHAADHRTGLKSLF